MTTFTEVQVEVLPPDPDTIAISVPSPISVDVDTLSDPSQVNVVVPTPIGVDVTLPAVDSITVLTDNTLSAVALSAKANKTNVLELDNVDPFTPSADNQPATRKFVLDNAGAGGNPTQTTYVPIGETYISAPVTEGVKTGGRWQGGGVGQQYSSPTNPTPNSLEGRVSYYVWDHGVVADPSLLAMFYYEGSSAVLRDFCLRGRIRIGEEAAIKPGYGILVHKNLSGPALGTGKIFLENMYIEDCAVGLQLSIDSSDPDYPLESDEENADNLILDRVVFRDCDIGVRMMHMQAMGHNLTNVIFRFCPVCVEVDGGGHVYMNNVHSFDAETAVLLNITAIATDTWWGNGSFHIRGTKWDAQKPAGSPFLAMNKTPGANLVCNILFEQCSIGNLNYPVNNSMFQISGGSICDIRNCVGISFGALDWWDEGNAKGPPMFVVSNCKFGKGIDGIFPSLPMDIFNPAGSYGLCYVHVTNCTDTNGQQIPDFHGTIGVDGVAGDTTVVDLSSTGDITGDGSITRLVKITQAAYDLLNPPVSTTLYVIEG